MNKVKYRVVFMALTLSLCAPSYGQGIRTYRFDAEGDNIPLGSRCYDVTGTMMLDEALSSNIECESNLTLCRKWRDKYKKELSKKCVDINYQTLEVEEEWSKKTWAKVAVGLALSFGLGASFGLVF